MESVAESFALPDGRLRGLRGHRSLPYGWGSRRRLFLFLVGGERGEGALTEALEFLKVLRMKSKEVQ